MIFTLLLLKIRSAKTKDKNKCLQNLKPKGLVRKNKVLKKRLIQKAEELRASSDAAAKEPKESKALPDDFPSSPKTNWKTEYDSLNTKYQFLLADFANYKKQQLKDLSIRKKYEGQVIIEKLIFTVIDDFERALEHVKNMNNPTEEINGLMSGFYMIYDNFKKMLQDLNVKQQDDTGKTFDPNIHHALDYIEDSSVPPEHILQTIKKAYFFHDKLLRPSEVIVSKKPKKPEEALEENLQEQEKDLSGK